MLSVVLLASFDISAILRDFVMKCGSLVVIFGKIFWIVLDWRLYLKVEWPPRRNVAPIADIVLFMSEFEPKVRLASRILSR